MFLIVDIDECERRIAGCHQGCRNTDGGFICTCDEGYQKHHNDPSYCAGMSMSIYIYEKNLPFVSVNSDYNSLVGDEFEYF